MARRPRSTRTLHEEARRHVVAVRAFHTGLVAETHRHLHVLAAAAEHIEGLRHTRRRLDERLASAQACCRELAKLRSLRQPWHDTYRDLLRSVNRARALFHSLMKRSNRTRARSTAGGDIDKTL